MWICPLSAIEQIQRPTGGSSSSARNAVGSALFCAWICAPRSFAAGWFAGQTAPSSRYAIDHSRSVSGGRPVIAHAQPTQSHGDEGARAWSWSVNVSPMTSPTTHAAPSRVAAHQ